VNLCYIQARAGSKRFPHKALAVWNGKSMIRDAIDKAKRCGIFDTILVTSDDPVILEIAGDCGVLPVWRPAELASDTATDDDVARWLLPYFKEYKYVCKLYPCIPLVTTDDLFNAYRYLGFSAGAYATYYGEGKTTGRDAGAFYIFEHDVFKRLQTISLTDFPWSKYPIVGACDINTPEDLEIAKKKAGLID
jgi:CMP-N-acetylneuraminic acid synthetase